MRATANATPSRWPATSRRQRDSRDNPGDPDVKPLQGKVAIVTGVSSPVGIGAASDLVEQPCKRDMHRAPGRYREARLEVALRLTPKRLVQTQST